MRQHVFHLHLNTLSFTHAPSLSILRHLLFVEFGNSFLSLGDCFSRAGVKKTFPHFNFLQLQGLDMG